MSKTLTLEDITRLYRDPRQPGSLGGVDKFLSALKKEGYTIDRKSLKRHLGEDDLYQLHKPSRKKFPRRPMIVQGIDHLWQADLSDVSSLKQHNSGNRFLVFVIDTFSKYAWVRAIKDKTAQTLTKAMKDILEASGRRPLHLQTDKGSEFVNRPFKELMKAYNINFYTSQNEETKAAFVERLQRTYKTKMFRYFTDRNTLRYLNVLQDLMHSYNSTVHSSTQARPIDVGKHNETAVRHKLCSKWKRGQGSQPGKTLQKGDQVRISIARHTFRKGYLPQWTEEIFTVHQKLPTKPSTFRLRDYNGEMLEGTFYRQELQKVPENRDRVYRVEEVLKTRKRGKKKEFYVKWVGYPKQFNSWISEDDMV